MAVLFIIHIPLEKVNSDLKNTDFDQVDQPGNGIEFMVGSDDRIKSCSDEKRSEDENRKSFGGVVSKTAKSSDTIQNLANNFDRIHSERSKLLPTTSKSDYSLRTSHSMTALSSMSQLEELVRRRKKHLQELASADVENSTWPRRSVASLTEDSVHISVGKFTVTKAPDGQTTDVLRPGGAGESRTGLCHFSDEVELETEVITFTLEEALFEVFDELSIENDVWLKNFDQNKWQIKFVVDTRECDRVLNRLTAFGLGRIAGTSVSVFPASFHYSGKSEEIDDSEEKNQEREEKSERREFVKSIKSRLTVAQVVGAVQSNAALTFDFLVLILLASIIAGLGLAESSSVVLVASMLISPLMGPIIGFTFGIVVKNPDLWRLGVRNELIGLSICLTFGFLFGLFTGCINNTAARWGSTEAWPTTEMKARGALRSLWVGVMIALPSGAGVALSILGGNTGSLVGVAISASLLPPAVNAGMLWGLALVSAISHPPLTSDNSTIYSNSPPHCRPLLNNEYEFMYSCEMPTEAAILASVSLLLTILNIICIFLMGILVLKIKEIAPHRAMSPATAAFWKRDLAFARSTYQTIKGRACLDMAKMAKDVLADIKAKTPDLLVDTVINDLQHDPSLFTGVPEPIREQGIPEFLRQLSHQGHELMRKKQLQQSRETVLVGDRYYHTVGNSAAAKQLLQSSPMIRRTLIESGNTQLTHRVLRVRMSTGNTLDDSPQSPVSDPHNGEVVMIGMQRGHAPRKIARKERLSAAMSLDSYSTPVVGGRFKVSTIPESSRILEGTDASNDNDRLPSSA